MSTQASSKEPVSDSQNDNQMTEDTSNTPLYFAVSPLKLVVMSVCTFGIYELYWFYKNWVLIKGRDRSDIMPFWRAFFAYFFCYSFFKKVKTSAEAVSLEGSLSPEKQTVCWIIINVLASLPEPFFLISYFAVIFLLPVQTVVNNINEVISPGHDKNSEFTGWNIFGVVVGGPLFILTIRGAFLTPV